MTDEMTETINRLNSDLHYQERQLHSLFSTLYSLVGKQYPGQVLSFFLKRPTAAITIGDDLTEISCTPINVTLLRCLRMEISFLLTS